jgi:hypothetical protein
MEPRPPSPGEPGYGPGGLPGQPGAPERRTLESCLTSCKTDNDCCDQSVTAKFTFQDGRGNTQIDLEKAVNVRGIREKPPKKLEAVGDQEICTFLIEDLKISPLVAKRLANELKKLKKYTKLASAPGAILSAGGLIGDAFYARAKGEIQKLSNMKHAGVDILICIPCCRRKPKNFWSRETTGSCDTQMYWLSLSWPMEGTTVEEARIFGWNRYADRDDRTKTWSLNPGEAEPRGNKPFRRVIDEQLELFNLLWKARCNEGELPGHCDDDCKSC